MPPAVEDPVLTSPAIADSVFRLSNRRFGDLRGLRWRVDLGVLPPLSSSSIDVLRRLTANSRRRYASLRRRLLAEPHILKDGTNSPNLVMDNPLSQNPDSTWSRFFRNVELERMVDQDLSRLYPEHGSYFQTPGCQSMLRRILLLWCLTHPECGYRQGMHELLAPLLYVLQGDLECLSEIRKLYKDHFIDRFDGLLCQDNNDQPYSFGFRKPPDLVEDEIGTHGKAMKVNSLDELDPEIQTIVLLSDAYGAEGELGIVLSEKFVEHDAYCMFDALMNGAHGSVAMADFFSSSPVSGSQTGLLPVIEASIAFYYLLSIVDSSLYTHLFELGVEPQYFSLRWLRVLFGREFSLANLLIIWDEIFASDNSRSEKSADDKSDSEFRILNSPRGAFISAMAVAMLLHLRSSLLATENPTRCLQRLLNFPENIDIEKLIEKAKSLQALALSVDISSPLLIGFHHENTSKFGRSVTFSSESVSPKTPLNLLPDSYWEEKWRVVHKAEELKQDGIEKQVPTRKKGWTEKVKFRLRRTESDPPLSRIHSGKKDIKTSVRRSLLEDLCKALGSEEDKEQMKGDEIRCQHDILSEAIDGQQESGCNGDNSSSSDERCPSGNSGSEEDLSMFSDSTSPPNEANEHENTSVKSSVASNVSLDECKEISATVSLLPFSDPSENTSPTSSCNNDDAGMYECNETSDTTSPNDPPLPILDPPPENIPLTSGFHDVGSGNSVTSPKEKRQNKFQWLWMFGRNNVEVASDKVGCAANATKSANSCSNQNDAPQPASSTSNGHCSPLSSRGDSVVDQNMMGTLKNIGQSMLEHIQVIESVFQQDRSQGAPMENLSKKAFVGKGQITAMTALKELRKISNLLSQM